MTNKGISISVSGGSAEFGNIVQGDNNRVSFSQTQALDDFYATISAMQQSHQIAIEEIDSLKKEIELLGEQIAEDDLVARAKSLYEKYSWAIDPLKKLFLIILP